MSVVRYSIGFALFSVFAISGVSQLCEINSLFEQPKTENPSVGTLRAPVLFRQS